MQNELLHVEVTFWSPASDEIMVDVGRCRRYELEAFIEKTRTEPTHIIQILVHREDADYLWNKYYRTWRKYTK